LLISNNLPVLQVAPMKQAILFFLWPCWQDERKWWHSSFRFVTKI